MFKILIVDDDDAKVSLIKKALLSSGINGECIVVCNDIVSAKSKLKAEDFELLILDVQLPVRKGQAVVVDGGIQLLRSLRADKLHFPMFVIGLTAFSDSFDKAVPIFQEESWTVVKFERSSIAWEDQLLRFVGHIQSVSKNRLFFSNREYDYDLALIAAVDVEFEALKKLSLNWERIKLPYDPTYYYVSKLKFPGGTKRVVLAKQVEMGMTAACLLTSKITFSFLPRYIGAVGLMAGCRGKANIGDVVAADPSWDYGSGKKIHKDGKTQLLPDPLPVRLGADVGGVLKDLSNDKDLLKNCWDSWAGNKPKEIPELKVGPVGSGASVLADGSTIEEVKDQARKTLGIDMEIFGLYFSAFHSNTPKPEFFSLKSVCDFGDGEKSDDFQEYCCHLSLATLNIFLAEIFSK